MSITRENVFRTKISLTKTTIFRYVNGDPPMLFNRKTGSFVLISEDLAKVLQYINKGLQLSDIIAKLEIKEEELDSLIDSLNILIKEGYLHAEEVH